MNTLDRELRRKLDKTVREARRAAEAGAGKVLEQYAVGRHEPHAGMHAEARELRNRLRAHARQLGDKRDPKRGTQAIDRLIRECAYEHWHRMLFARFLAESDLLIEPESGVPISLEECRDLSREEGVDWLALASDYAERMLPQIFRKDSPVLVLSLPPETRIRLEELLKDLPREVFTAEDSLGWVYQFWQADQKDAVNRSEKKIGADELPAVTQLFTEDYMVLFLLHNTLGAWWAGKVLANKPELAASAVTEDELRAACTVGGVEWTYLRFVRDKAEDESEGPWRPAAGAFEGWPKAAKGITVLDPCMGSGHFLIFALPILVALRMAEEALDQTLAIEAVLQDNLFGLEIDPRCTQIAAFNLAFAAWRRIGIHPLPQLNLACSGLSIGVTKAEWSRLAEIAAESVDPEARRDLLGADSIPLTQGLEERTRNGLETLYDLFAKAPWLGSLIDPQGSGGNIFRRGFSELEHLLASMLVAADSEDVHEMAVVAQGMTKAAEILGKRFCLVTTNVPYLTRGRQDDILRSYCAEHFSTARPDLATTFAERCLRFCNRGGFVAIVTPQNWLFLDYYKRFRKFILKNVMFQFGAEMGAGAFETISGEVVQVVLLCLKKNSSDRTTFCAVDVSKYSFVEKESQLIKRNINILSQQRFLEDDDLRILFENVDDFHRLSDYAEFHKGLCTGDDMRFKRCFWEIKNPGARWSMYQGSPERTMNFGGFHYLLDWENGEGSFVNFVKERLASENISAWIRGTGAWGRMGVTIRCLGNLPATRYLGTPFDTNVAVLVPKSPKDFDAIWTFCSSDEYMKSVRKINRKMNVGDASLVKVPFDADRWKRESRNRSSDNTRSSRMDDATQFLFDGNPAESRDTLGVAVARLLGYQWLRQQGGQVLGFPNISSDAISDYADIDGIVCFTSLKGEVSVEQRLRTLLKVVFDDEWSASRLDRLLIESGFGSKSLEDWLRDGFFVQHCDLFHQRPFILHVWDGRRDGFHALVNYHRLVGPNGEGRRTLDTLIYSYLGEWVDRQQAAQAAGLEGADARLAHAKHLRQELIKIREGEPPYDIFVRWKPLHEQAIGWEPAIDDGVRLNIRPFMMARPLGAKAKNACILRTTPKIKWQKDRGKEPTRDKEDYPWFWGWDGTSEDFPGGAEFDGNRWNDLHYSRAFKQAARDRRQT